MAGTPGPGGAAVAPTAAERLPVRDPRDLGPAAVVRIAYGQAVPEPAPALLARVEATRREVLAALTSGEPVYGVNTAMGALSGTTLSAAEQARHQEALMLARSAGGPPWLDPAEVRAVLAVRLRTFLNDDSGVSAELCRRLADLLARGVLPAVPRSDMGTAGEIIALAHLAAPIGGRGAVLPGPGAPAAADDVPAGPALESAGLSPYALGPKEGVALIQGVPVTTALAILCADAARTLLRQSAHVLAAQFSLTRASRDVLDPALARADDVLAGVIARVSALAGREPAPRALQPPVSFRVSAQVLAHLERATGQLEEAITRALDGVTDSPAFVRHEHGGGGRFVGTAGFHGYDLAAHLHMVTVALVGAAEVGATRLHRLMDPGVSGLPAQLSPRPGPHTGLSPVHKRAVGVCHGLRRLTLPSTAGPVETSAGQEDVQSHSVEAAGSCRRAVEGLREVLACEVLALHQARLLGARLAPDASAELARALDRAAEALPSTPQDRPFGPEVTALSALLRSGWAGAEGGVRAEAGEGGDGSGGDGPRD